MDFELEYCCFCVDLRIGSLIFGYLHLLKDVTHILASTSMLFSYVTDQSVYAYHYGKDVQGITFSAIFLVFGLVTLAFTISLLKGLNQYKPQFVKAFLIFSDISTVIYSSLCLFLICQKEIFIALVPGLMFLVVYIYFLLIITSYYPKMNNSDKSKIFSIPAGPYICSVKKKYIL